MTILSILEKNFDIIRGIVRTGPPGREFTRLMSNSAPDRIDGHRPWPRQRPG
jgi:hypothetical protein